MFVLSILTFILAACAAENIDTHQNWTHPSFRPEARSCSLISVERRVDCLPAVSNGNQSMPSPYILASVEAEAEVTCGCG